MQRVARGSFKYEVFFCPVFFSSSELYFFISGCSTELGWQQSAIKVKNQFASNAENVRIFMTDV